MKIYAVIGLLVASTALSACVVDADPYDRGYRGPRANVEYNYYDDRDYDYDRHDNRHRWHCPPGQAKKGNC